MTKFYIQPGQGLDYISGIQVVKNVRNTLIESSKDPLNLIKQKTDFFGNIIKDPAFDSIISFCPVTDEMSKTLAECLKAVVSVIDRRQFNMSSNDQIMNQTKSARLHNIDSEELMGMFSAAKQKAPNATLCFLSSKLRACKNKTTALLSKKPTDIQNKLTLWAISNARETRFANAQSHKEMTSELIKRMADKIQNKKFKEQKKIEKILKNCMPNQIKEIFPDLENNEASNIEEILTGAAIGRCICQLWFDNATNSQDVYCGRFLSIKKKNSGIYIVSYWKPNENEDDDAVEYEMSKYQLSAGIISGNMVIS